MNDVENCEATADLQVTAAADGTSSPLIRATKLANITQSRE